MLNRDVLIIGAGGVGRVVAHSCAAHPETFGRITIASRTKARCDEIADSLAIEVRTAQVDADNKDELLALIKDVLPGLVIHVALPYQDLTIMQACLEAGVHYIDTANYEHPDEAKFYYGPQWDYHQAFKDAGLIALLGSGFDPGVTNVFVAHARKHHFDEIETVDILDCNGGDHGYPFATNFNPEINIREVSANGRFWKDNKWHETAPMEIHRSFDFPEVGKKEMYLLYHEEMESLSKHFPEIKQFRFWMTFSESYLKHLEVLNNVGMTGIEPIEFAGQKIIPLHFLKALLPDPASLGPRTVGKTCIGCWVNGKKNGESKSYYVYNICDHQECYKLFGSQAVSYTTGVPASIGAKMLLEDYWHGSGVFNMEQFDPDPFMSALNDWGLPWQDMTTELTQI